MCYNYSVMKALVWKDIGEIELVDRPMPELCSDKDAIIKVVMSSICTSDLHIIKGFVPKASKGIVLGHEFVGEVHSVGSGVKKFVPGDRVSANCETFCGECWFCKRGFVNNCENGGWEIGCSTDGCQAEYVRVSYADSVLTKLPESVSFENALFVGDILSSGYWGAELCEIKHDDVVAIIGAGPVGLCSMLSAKMFGPSRIVAIDTDDSRLSVAKENGLADIFLNPDKCDIGDEVRKLTDGRGADSVIEAAGSSSSFQMAWEIARANAIVAVVAMYEKNQVLPLPNMYGKNLTFKTGGVDAAKCEKLVELISQNKINTDFLITHKFSLENIKEAYKLFENKDDNCLKIAITN